MALLSSLARDPLLRSSAPSVLDLQNKELFNRDVMKEAIATFARDRLNDSTLDKVVRNAASSWTQSGHLEGRTFKKRAFVRPTKGSVALAILLGYLQGIRGPNILQTIWCNILDASSYDLARAASTASMAGLMQFKHAGTVLEAGFPELLTAQEKGAIYESDRAAS